ncbi:MAG: Holliday junction DNA helicase RuvA [Candidatus Staskawiczbacteria bacterium RIFCSPLOWO2_01_FULL_40_39]|uniref:Holliday junction branch migration complex subunit RuvA n=1 Tax=Candidatus Staskawiczbacteria bacterium RIFCSPHIGHO2_01_FULL_39_25 TaxID=1802202 RepID=A0A1G2HMT5_9BACT|nr:MAG: Holliday junction DNA helicase RuvA [Candidatus Staskawiczbacteria bacterium RIFCSPHIGHO2_01_FULL_39_25]OGZ73210.1 MAG: Holliday junction DNA helicase RuvA [Candidatus Staskawiczbacteria bacterium RIFCSPLOWO2_01_FULL_40_39]OGZ75246.1 MAG: Holliday junction DNA helicase RuvA [Candidatus Staskawiczbacteria bacterium RIFCSPLOWO2_02_FULL_39_8]
MITFLAGKILLKKDKFIILEVAGIGYKVFLSRQTLLKLPEISNDIKLFCFQNVKEDALDLYGFLTYDELDFFEVLMDIRGVGPKSALDIAALGSLEKIKDRILAQDEKIFEGIPGIGAKKAMTIILELTGKIKLLSGAKSKGSTDSAEDALVQLGFSRQQAKEALRHVSATVKSPEERVEIALKSLGKN